MFTLLRNGLLRYILYTCPNLYCNSCSQCYGMDYCFGTYFTHVQTCTVTRVHSATEWTASECAEKKACSGAPLRDDGPLFLSTPEDHKTTTTNFPVFLLLCFFLLVKHAGCCGCCRTGAGGSHGGLSCQQLSGVTEACSHGTTRQRARLAAGCLLLGDEVTPVGWP